MPQKLPKRVFSAGEPTKDEPKKKTTRKTPAKAMKSK
jgi:hypothetical protein